MKPVTTVLLAGLLVSGCVHRHVTVVDSPREPEVYGEEEVYDDGEVLYEEECEPVWDGHTFVVVESHIHGGACGHWYHHGCWHLYPEYHVYSEFGYSWCGDTGGFYYGGDPCARVWDGLVFLFLRGHVHGGGCGHFYHHGCWNTCQSNYVHVDAGHHHFTSSPPRPRTVVSASHVGGGSGEARRAVASPGTRAAQTQRNAPARRQPAQAQRAGQAPQAGQAQRAGQPAKRGQPQRVEPPAKREQPQRVERPQRRQDPPKREQPQRIEQPPKRQDPPKREQPQRIEQPPRRQEGPKREAPQKQEPPKKREAEKKEPEKRR